MPKSSSPQGDSIMIHCNNVGIFYPNASSMFPSKREGSGYWALKDLTFDLHRGETLGIIGKNGAGKSTALAVINKIIEPDQGAIESFDNTSMLLSINAGLSANLSGRKNIYLIGLTLGLSKKDVDEKIEQIIDFTEIRDFIDRPVDTYSTGMKTRLGFSTALFLEPDVLLVDEALGVGDKDFKRKSHYALKDKLKNNSTAIIVSHSESTIRDLCSKVLLMEHGKSVAIGTSEEMFKLYNAT